VGLDGWLASLGQAVFVVVLVHLLAGALFGAALATWTRFPLWLGILLGIFVPVVGPIVAAIVATVRRTPEASRAARPNRLRVNALWLVVPAVGVFIALLLPWWIARLQGVPSIPLFPAGRFLDTVIIVTLAIIVGVGAMVGIAGMVHLGAALLVMPLVVWSFVLAAMASMTRSIQDTLTGVASLPFTAADLVQLFGISAGDLPLEELGIDADELDLTDFVGAASVELGAGWYVMLVAALLLAAWVVWAAFVPARSRASES
jgi:hypothetical protein